MKIEDFLRQLCEHCGVDPQSVTITVDEDAEYVRVSLVVAQEDSGLFIGYHGETLESIQRILRLIFQRSPEDKKIILNVNEYREQRSDKLRELTRSVAQKVLDTGIEHVFHNYLPPHERFVIHTTLAESEEFAGLESISTGNGKDRKLCIRLKQ